MGNSRTITAKYLLLLFCLATVYSPIVAFAQSKTSHNQDLPLEFRHLLYVYHMEPPLTALSEINTAIERNNALANNPSLALIRSRLYLELGHIEQAQRLLLSIPNKLATEPQKNQLLLTLAAEHYELGNLQQSQKTLASITNNFSRKRIEQRQLQEGMTYLAQNKYKKAIKVLDNITGNSVVGTYARFNLGVALLNLRRFDDGIKQLDKVGKSNYWEDELKNLKDYANISLGFLFLKAQEPAIAKSYLSRVRLDATFSNRALLGMGWASIIANENKEALLALLELHDRPTTDNTVIEAYLAVPHALRNLKSDNHALDYYDQAIVLFEKQAVLMNKLMEELKLNPSRAYDYLTPSFPLSANSPEEVMVRIMSTLSADPRYNQTKEKLDTLNALKDDIPSWQTAYEQHSNSPLFPVEKKALDKQVNNLQIQVDKAIELNNQLLSAIVLSALKQESDKLNQNTDQVRFSMAQIYDKILNQRVIP